MNDQDYIRKAVELADGWTHDGCEVSLWITSPETFGGFWVENQCLVDALAAQLVRQVDARWTDGYRFASDDEMRSVVYGPKFKAFKGYVNSIEQGPDRTMNTIKVIIDSGVLTNGSNHGN